MTGGICKMSCKSNNILKRSTFTEILWTLSSSFFILAWNPSHKDCSEAHRLTQSRRKGLNAQL